MLLAQLEGASVLAVARNDPAPYLALAAAAPLVAQAYASR